MEPPMPAISRNPASSRGRWQPWLAALSLLAAVLPISATEAQEKGCWRAAECGAEVAVVPQDGDFRYAPGTTPEADFRTPDGKPMPPVRRLDGTPVTDTDRRLLRPETWQFRRYGTPSSTPSYTALGTGAAMPMPMPGSGQ